jgi:acetyl-CoA synthetase (ADP-forming)
VLAGARGGTEVDLAAVARLSERTAELLLEASLAEIELNPVLASAEGAVAVDALVRPWAGRPALTR